MSLTDLIESTSGRSGRGNENSDEHSGENGENSSESRENSSESASESISSELVSEDYKDYVISPEHWNNLCEDLPKKLLKSSLLYVVRLYIETTNSYKYKVGFTENFKKRLESLNSEYGSCGRIIPVMLAYCNKQKKERQIHRMLKRFNDCITIGFVRHRELYSISPESYDLIKETFMDNLTSSTKVNNSSISYSTKSTSAKFWESEIYVIDEKRDNEDKTKANKALSYFEQYDCVYLNQDRSEDAYWSFLHE